MARLQGIRALLVVLAALGAGCWDRTGYDVPLAEVGGSGVTGTAHLRNAFCKSNCARISVDLAGPSASSLAVDLREGRCAALGTQVDAFQFPCGDVTPCEDQLSSTSDVRTLVGDHAVAVWLGAAWNQDGTLVACGDI